MNIKLHEDGTREIIDDDQFIKASYLDRDLVSFCRGRENLNLAPRRFEE